MEKKNENRSLFLYTALIFIVALLLIIISFFGDSHVRQQQPQVSADPSATPAAVSGLTERATQLSEDNRILLERNKVLEAAQAEMETQNARLKEETAAAVNQNAMSERLFDIYMMLYNRKYSDAKTALAEINPDTLDEKQKEFYDILVKKAK